MCGRYFFTMKSDVKEYKWIAEKVKQLDIYGFCEGEIFPSQNALVLTSSKQDDVTPCIKKWGIKGYKGNPLINARMEGIADKYTFRPLLHNRCVILANGFYEWVANGKSKDKMRIEKQGEPLLYLAGIYNAQNEFVIVTGESYGDMADIHKRTPIIMKEEEMLAYLHEQRDFIVDNEAIVASVI